MPPRHNLSLMLLLLLVPLALAGRARADGLPIGPAAGDAQSRPKVVSDGRGGALVSYKTATLYEGAVHVNASGIADGGIGFAPVAVPMALEAGEPVRLSLPSDSQVVLVGDRGTESSAALTSLRAGGTASVGFSKDIGVFRLAADGSRPWGDQPVPLIFAAFDQVDPRLVPDGAGGAIIVWTDPRDPARGPPIALETTSPLAPGLYFARVRQGGASARVRVTVLR